MTAADQKTLGPGRYRVLARKYRPARFADLIGQEALVRTLTNAIARDRVAHAFVLTGVRGVGKTTTARIIARALNCIGPDGKGGPTADPCGACEHCLAIAEDRHMDVVEMDAASRTGVDDIRELIDGVRYRPVSARFKIHIVDEVHMLSKNAFNALLKTLEEPPEHVKFIFATTEIRKVPVTVLSRCQRFDLRRIEVETLREHLLRIAAREGRELDQGAATLIARAADGSARDGLSLLDRAFAHVEGKVDEDSTRDLLGLVDRSRVLDLFEAVMRGDVEGALAIAGELYRSGGDPVNVVEDLLAITHALTRLAVAPRSSTDAGLTEAERRRMAGLAAGLSIPVLARAWQMLLKGLSEAQGAHDPLAALEMVVVRLAYVAELPPPGDLAGGAVASEASRRAPEAARPRGGAGTVASAVRVAPEVDARPAETPGPMSFAELARWTAERREGLVNAHLVNNVHLVRFEDGRIEFRPTDHAPRDLASRLMELLRRWTGRRWVVAISNEIGEPTLAEQDAMRREQERQSAARHPLVRAILDTFPGATIEAVRRASGVAAGDGEADDEPTDHEE